MLCSYTINVTTITTQLPLCYVIHEQPITCSTLFSLSHAAILSAVRKSSSSTLALEAAVEFEAVAAEVTATADVVEVMPGPRC